MFTRISKRTVILATVALGATLLVALVLFLGNKPTTTMEGQEESQEEVATSTSEESGATEGGQNEPSNETPSRSGEETSSAETPENPESPSEGSAGSSGSVVLHEMQGTTEELVTGLDTPWEVVFLPDGTLLVAERPGRVTHIGKDGSKSATTISGAVTDDESGVNGMALDPNFSATKHVFVYYRASDGNRVARYTYQNRKLVNPVTIISGIPAARWHDGGRIAFGPDGLLYITTGDALNENDAQDTSSLAGKILRIRKDGSIPSDNPFGNAVWSYGHRNPQGLAWDSAGRLWATEHGPSGGETGNDEVNLIVKGNNYGWPVIRGKETREGMVTPVIESTRQETWAPAGVAYWNGSLFFGGLRGETLYEAHLSGGSITSLERHLAGQYARIRAVKIGPDGMLYFSTSNRSEWMASKKAPNDDRIIRVNPSALFR